MKDMVCRVLLDAYSDTIQKEIAGDLPGHKTTSAKPIPVPLNALVTAVHC